MRSFKKSIILNQTRDTKLTCPVMETKTHLCIVIINGEFTVYELINAQEKML